MRCVRFWIVLALLGTGLAGCGRDTGKVAKDGKIDGKAVDSKNADGKKQLYLAFVSNNEHDFWNIAKKGTERAAKEFDVRVEFRRPQGGTADVQRQIIEDLLNKGVKGIAVSANNPKNMQDFFRNEVGSKVPLIMADNDIPDYKARRCYIGTNNYLAGQAVGEMVIKALPDGGKIAIFVGDMDAMNARERRQGVLDYLADSKTTRKEVGEITPPDAANLTVGKYTLLSTKTDGASPEKCQSQTSELLLQNPDIDCLIGLWEYNPPALLRASRESNLKKKPIIVGFDENYQTLDGVESGEVFATIVQNPEEFGYRSIKVLVGLAKGDESILKGAKDIDDQNRIYIPHRVITKDNVGPFYSELKKLKGS